MSRGVRAHASYQAGLIKRTRRTKSAVEQLERQIVEVLRSDRPQSVRHIFYRMTDPRLPEPVEKTEQGYAQVQDRITKMRRSGMIPYGWITDATRRGYHVTTFGSAGDALLRWHGGYRADLWSQANTYVEVWCESRSIAGVIEDTCVQLAVSLYPAGGFTSLTLAYQAAKYINTVTSNGAIPANVIFIGDYDPAGMLIGQKAEEELRTHLHRRITLDFRRIAITEEQIATMDLPTKPRKKGERRLPNIRETVEAEAMPAGVLRDLLRREVEAFLPEGALEKARAAEESEKRLILWAADEIAKRRDEWNDEEDER